jgi:alanine racemase
MNPVSDSKSQAPGHAVTLESIDSATLAAATGIFSVDLDALVGNWRQLSGRSLPAECAAVVKADAYGCGLPTVVTALAAAGCKTFFVATLAEARAARAVTKTATIYVLDGCFVGAAENFAEIDARPVIGDLAELAEWDAFCRRTGWAGGAAIHIDTGMNRLGLAMADAQALLPRIQSGGHGFTLVMSHLVSAEALNNPVNARQVRAFQDIALAYAGIPASLSNSSGVFLGPQFQFDLMRPGAALYGINPTPEADNPMQQVVTLKARVVQIRELEAGATVGYGGAWTARRATRIAIVSAGYADGYLRGAKGAEVMMAGRRCPVVGRISMDLLAVDIGELALNAVRRGQLVTLIGDGITVDELAKHFGTIGYEVLTSIGRRYTRVYHGGGV